MNAGNGGLGAFEHRVVHFLNVDARGANGVQNLRKHSGAIAVTN